MDPELLALKSKFKVGDKVRAVSGNYWHKNQLNNVVWEVTAVGVYDDEVIIDLKNPDYRYPVDAYAKDCELVGRNKLQKLKDELLNESSDELFNEANDELLNESN